MNIGASLYDGITMYIGDSSFKGVEFLWYSNGGLAQTTTIAYNWRTNPTAYVDGVSWTTTALYFPTYYMRVAYDGAGTLTFYVSSDGIFFYSPGNVTWATIQGKAGMTGTGAIANIGINLSGGSSWVDWFRRTT
jgi:hypothetical protein